MLANRQATRRQAFGLTSSEVTERRQRFGWNEIIVSTGPSMLRVLLRQFTSILVLILIVAAAISYYLGDIVDMVAIGLVVLLNGILGFVQEWRAERAVKSLRKLLAPTARVVRDGHEQIVEARSLVPDDLVIVEAGDRIPADLIPHMAIHLEVDESVLTGESLPVEKSTDTPDTRLFMGTTVAAGRAEGIVSATGTQTEFGHIAELTGSVRETDTPLQRHFGLLARQLGLTSVLIALGIIAAGLLAGRALDEMYMTGLSIAVAMVPEGLPAVVTITMALGASAMVRQKALARRLQAVETLGGASVICTDKTGTLTENKMTAARIWMVDKSFEVTGTGYDPAGHIADDGGRVRAADDAGLSALLDAAIHCSHARLDRRGNDWVMIGEPTEAALVTLAYKGWADLPDPGAVLQELPFSSERKRMSVVVRHGDAFTLHAKGAPEAILAVSTHVRLADGVVPLDDNLHDAIRTAYTRLASDGLRVIALAERPIDGSAKAVPEEKMVFLGLVGLIDPPRPEVAAAVQGARAAGIRVIMITGDSPVTADAIARQLGLPVGTKLTGADIDSMDDEALGALVQQDVLFARTTPAHKLRIVRALQANDQVVAMTGDGVNDAPALKQADIGVAMGVRGTDVAKDASDLVLLDDNFATIVRAIAEGRRQFENVKKYVRYLLSSNAGEVVAIVINLAIGGPLVFLATQILWMNLVTDSVTAVALGLEKAEAGQMKRPPRRKDAPILGRSGLLTILTFGLYTGCASLWMFYTFLPQGEAIARTAAFSAMVIFEKASVFAFRSLRQPCTGIGWFSNPLLLLAMSSMLLAQVAAVYWPPLQVLLQTAALGWQHWAMIGAFALPVILVPEAFKAVLSLRPRPTAVQP